MSEAHLVIAGAGGHARSLVSLLRANKLEPQAIVDAHAAPGEMIMGIAVVTSIDHLNLEGEINTILAIGDNALRKTKANDLKAQCYTLPLTHPSSFIDETAVLGCASQIFAGAYVGPLAEVGQFAIINTHAVIEHEASVGAFSHVAVGAKLLGRTRIGESCFIGAGAVIKDGISICDGVTVGANSFVNKSIDEPGVYVGSPARKLNR